MPDNINDLFLKSMSADTQGVALTIDSMQVKFRENFAGTLSTLWDTTLGTGATATASSGTLTFASGTTASNTATVVSKQLFTIPVKLAFSLSLSQRIANQTFYVELVSVDPTTLLADDKNVAAWRFDGTTATNAIYEVTNGGLTRLSSSAVTITTTATSSLFEIEPFVDETWFHQNALDVTTSRTGSWRRQSQSPDPTLFYRVRLRWVNGATPPASSTNAVFTFVSVSDNTEITAEITGGRGGTSAGQAVPVVLTGAAASSTAIGTVTVSGMTVAEDAATTASPVITGGVVRAASAPPTTFAAGDAVRHTMTTSGALVAKPFSVPEGDFTFTTGSTPVTSTGNQSVQAAAGAGLRRYVTSMQLSNTGSAVVDLNVRDASGIGTILWSGRLQATGNPIDIQFPIPLRTAQNSALFIEYTVTAGGSGTVNIQGFTAP
ncbi:hypothetical protein EB077_06700 [bacterium]|nr:hypothetical protein [bacterium]NDG19297.1 hypothetical protein [Betaproteobacteria bacterium]